MISIEPVAHVVAADDFVAEAVDDFALLVHHVVEIERAFALLEVALLDALLRRLDGMVEQRMLQFLAFFEAETLHDLAMRSRAEDAHQIVFERNEKVRRTGIALARATAAQLAVDAARFVALGADDVQAAQYRPRPARA